MAFFPLDHVVFASDCPFDPEKGTAYIRETLKIVDSLDLSKADRDKVYYKNLERITGKTFVKP
jgi:predicted TIM-barrel fold metal-dependent hydrolase